MVTNPVAPTQQAHIESLTMLKCADFRNWYFSHASSAAQALATWWEVREDGLANNASLCCCGGGTKIDRE